LLTPNWVIGTFFVIGLIFIPIGAVIVSTSNNVVEVKMRYDKICALNTVCNVNVTIPEDMSAPVYFYYELDNYFQNHRRYVKSRSDAQLRGELGQDIDLCDPIERNGNDVIVPCGLVAYSYFQDKFGGTYDGAFLGNSTSPPSTPQWRKKGIAWDSDVDYKFKSVGTSVPAGFTRTSVNSKGQTVTLPDMDDEDFIVWMRTAGLPRFKKLHRIIDKNLQAGKIFQFTIHNNYDVSTFDGEKSVVLSTTSWLGGKNTFLGWSYVTVGIVCILLAFAFALKQYVSPRRLGDMQYFNWSGGAKLADDQ
jgi:cell cycle control protein 50